MNIALFTDTYLPDINGVVSSVEILRKKLVEQNHNVYVVCPYPDILGSVEIVKENNVIKVPGIELKQMYGYTLTPPFHYALIEELEKLNLDIIHSHTEFGVGIFARIVANKLKIPLVSTYHTTYEDYTHYLNIVNMEIIDKIAKKGVAFLSKIYSDSSVRLIAPSFKTKMLLVGYGINKDMIDVVPTGLELERFYDENVNKEDLNNIKEKLNLKYNYKIFIYVGRLAAEKSIDMIIKGFGKVKDLTNSKLIIVGGGPEDENLKKLTNSLNLDDHIIFTGKVPQNDIPKYYKLANVFISASTSETQGMTYIEALSSGLLVLGRKDEVLFDLIDEGITGDYFNNEDELKELIEKYQKIDNFNDYKTKCENKVKKFDSNIFVSKILDSYQKAIEEFNDCYLVENIKVKNDNILLILNNKKEAKIELLISLDNYYENNIKKGKIISNNELSKYQKEEKILKAYLSCIKKITTKDYTAKQIYDYIIKNYDIDAKDVNDIIEKLESKKLINDKRYTINKLESFKTIFLSKDRIKQKLLQDGISIEIIDECLKDYGSELEFDSAFKKALKYQKTIVDKSLNYKKNMIFSKLINDGFNNSIIKEVMKMLDFKKEEENNENILNKEVAKALNKYKKFSGMELRNKIFKYLYSKGFENSDIYKVLAEREWEDEE